MLDSRTAPFVASHWHNEPRIDHQPRWLVNLRLKARPLLTKMPLRNSLHRRNHKERSQLAHRQRLGVLEKHKDYVLRARDYHSKRDRLKRLAQKAADRNKDEFYFSMNRQRTEVRGRGSADMPSLKQVKAWCAHA